MLSSRMVTLVMSVAAIAVAILTIPKWALDRSPAYAAGFVVGNIVTAMVVAGAAVGITLANSSVEARVSNATVALNVALIALTLFWAVRLVARS